MKIIFFSDIHGIKTNLEKLGQVIEKEQPDKIVVLGDLYYIGPRNNLTSDYDITFVKNFLEKYSSRLLVMQGNCDSEIDVEVSQFPIIPRISLIETKERNIYITHGHLYNKENPFPLMKKGDCLVYGHFHIPLIEEKDGCLFLSPGSISLPKGDSSPSYMIYENNNFIIYSID